MTTTVNRDIVSTVRRVVRDQLGVDESKIVLASSFVDDLGADSLQVVDLTLALEEEFGIQIDDEAAKNLRTVDDAVRYIERQSRKRPVPANAS